MTIWHDLRHGARMLAKNPGFTLVAVASIAIGVGANAAMFSAADTLVLRPLTVPRASEIVNVASVVPRTGFASPTSAAVSYPDYVDVRDQSRSFASLAALRLVVTGFAQSADKPAERKFGMAVSGNLFDAFGVQPALGRAFGVEQDRVVGRDPVVVLDHDFWEQQFGSDTGIVGRRVRIGGVDMTVTGVMPRGFTGPDQFVLPSFYIPLAMLPSLQTGPRADELTRRDVRNLLVKGRLKPGVSLAQADEEMRLIGENLQSGYPGTNRNQGLAARSEFGARVSARPQLAVAAAMLMTLSLAVLLVACANVAGLLASRAPVRAREMALRLAIGAGRSRLVRQLVSESLLIAAGGGIAGLVVAYGIIRVFQGIQIPSDVPLKFAFVLDERALFVGSVVAAISAVLSSLIPAWRSSRTDLVATLKNATADASRRSRLWGRHTLVAGQVALSLVLLTVTVFLYRGYQVELLRGPGFRTDHILSIAFDPELARYDGSRTDSFYRELTERAKALPGVKSVTLTSSVPMDQISIENTPIAPEGFQFAPGTDHVNVRSARVDESYFDALGIEIVRGRSFRSTDTADATRVAIVNETLAAHYWPGRDAIGRRLRLIGRDDGWIEIVGIVANSKYRALAEAPTEFIYYPRLQQPVPHSTLLVQTEGDPASMTATLRDMVRTIDPNMPMFDVRTMEDLYWRTAVGTSRLLINIVGGMGLLGLVLAMAGLYGLVAYSVSQRTREIGIRMAVGARPGSVLRMVLRHGLVLAAGGTIVGAAGSAAANGVLHAMFAFPEVSTVDIVSYSVVVPTLLALTLLAAYFPARRAARVDPLVALRQE